jgi:hypothetical protein
LGLEVKTRRVWLRKTAVSARSERCTRVFSNQLVFFIDDMLSV